MNINGNVPGVFKPKGQEAPHTGTTIVACTYKGGVVLGADGRVSTGAYIMNRSSNKIAPLAEHVFLLRSGSAPDAQMVSDYVSHYVAMLEGELGGQASVATIAKLVATMNYQNKDVLVGALVIAGYDEEGQGQVYGCPIGGTLSQEAWAIDGSGSTYIWGFCDANFREGFTRQEAESFVTEALALAMASDCSSGGCIRLVTVDASGAHHTYIPGSQVPYPDMMQPLAAAVQGGMVLGPCAAQCTRGAPTLWLESSCGACITTALELGVKTIVTNIADVAALGDFERLRRSTDDSSDVVDGDTGEKVAKWHTINSAAHLKALETSLGRKGQAGELKPSRLTTLVMDASDWKVIPAENLIALVQAHPLLRLLAVVGSAQEAALMLGALEVGTAGVVLRTDQVDVLRQTWVLIQQLAAAKAAPALQLGRAVVTRVAPMGMGERVCVDCTSLMWPGEGLLCGNFARALFLVHSECAETSYIAARPFRVNAGAVHGYVLAPEGRTAYLAELSCGNQVLVADPAGRTRSVTVGRSKLERRPLILVEAQLADGDLVSVLLQNAETVRLVGSQSEQPGGRTQVAGTALVQSSVDGLNSRDADTEVGSVDAPELGAQWRAVPVTQLQVGHTLLIHQPSAGARHMGLPVEEFMLEK